MKKCIYKIVYATAPSSPIENGNIIDKTIKFYEEYVKMLRCVSDVVVDVITNRHNINIEMEFQTFKKAIDIVFDKHWKKCDETLNSYTKFK